MAPLASMSCEVPFGNFYLTDDDGLNQVLSVSVKIGSNTIVVEHRTICFSRTILHREPPPVRSMGTNKCTTMLTHTCIRYAQETWNIIF